MRFQWWKLTTQKVGHFFLPLDTCMYILTHSCMYFSPTELLHLAIPKVLNAWKNYTESDANAKGT